MKYIFKINEQEANPKELQKFDLLSKELQKFYELCNGGTIMNMDSRNDLICVKTVSNTYFNEFCPLHFLEINTDDRWDNLLSLWTSLNDIKEWYRDSSEVQATPPIPFNTERSGFFAQMPKTGEIRYFCNEYDFEGNLEEFPILAPSFTSFLKLIIDQNGGYIENLSEIYDELVAQGFR